MIVADPLDDTKIDEVKRALDQKGVSIQVSETPLKDVTSLLGRTIRMLKTEVYSVESRGKTVPQELTQKVKQTTELLDSVKNNKTKVFTVKASVETRIADYKTVNEALGKIKNLTHPSLGVIDSMNADFYK